LWTTTSKCARCYPRHFAGNPHIAAVFEAANAAAALAGTEEHRPTAIVLDLALRVLRVGGQ